ncbi:MAG: CHASE2 domain-containing protein [bacterium]|nr:CHASE2 domain-containing protein [bacterium]
MRKVKDRFWGIKVCLFLSFITSVIFLLGWVESLENMGLDLRFRLRGPIDPKSDIVIVAIDAVSMKDLGHWPWSRRYHARLIDMLAKAQAKVIGLDLSVIEEEKRDTLSDAAFFTSATRAGNIVYPVFFDLIRTDSGKKEICLKPLPALKETALGLGHIEVEPSLDGILRKINLVRPFEDEGFLSFGLEIVRAARDISLTDLKSPRGNTFIFGPLEIPMDDEGRMLINYCGGQHTVKTFSYIDVLEERIPLSEFTGKIVLVGITAKKISDEFMTPFSDQSNPMPGVEIHANVIRTIIEQDYIRRADRLTIILLIFLAGIALSFLFHRLSPRKSLVVTFLLCLFLGIISVTAFNYDEIWIDIIPFVLLMGTSWAAITLKEVNAANRSLDEEVTRLSEIYRTSGKSLLSQTTEETPRQMIYSLKDFFNLKAVILFLYEERKKEFTAQFTAGIEAGSIIKSRFKLGEGLVGKVAQQKELKTVEGLEQPFDLSEAGTSAFLPLNIKDRCVGVLVLCTQKSGTFSRDNLDFLNIVANRLAQLIEIERTYETLSSPSIGPLNILSSEKTVQKVEALAAIYNSIILDRIMIDNILNDITDGIMVADCLGVITYANPQFKALLNVPDEREKLNIIEIIKEFGFYTKEELLDEFYKVVANNRILSLNLEMEKKNKSYNLSLASFRDKRERTIGLVGVLHDVTYLKEISQAKSEFVATVSHELRTPLTSIRGVVELLLTGMAKGDIYGNKQELLEIALRNTNRLTKLVEDILSLSKIESGKIKMELEETDLVALIQYAVSEMNILAEDNNISIHTSMSQSLPLVLADADRINQVLVNLLSNAIKFSRRGGRITIEAVEEPEWIKVRVVDTGIGIPAEEMSKIFEKFHSPVTTKGTGLGLSICKAIIEEHGGRIWAESRVGKGSTFCFTLPKAVDR